MCRLAPLRSEGDPFAQEPWCGCETAEQMQLAGQLLAAFGILVAAATVWGSAYCYGHAYRLDDYGALICALGVITTVGCYGLGAWLYNVKGASLLNESL